MASKAIVSLGKITDRIKKSLGEAVSRKEMLILGDFTVDLIVKRTRLGYGVSRNMGVKKNLKPLSAKYKLYRKRFKNLSSRTTPGRSNLTLTNQMLESMDVTKSKDGSFTLSPTGFRRDTFATNLEIAGYQEEMGRTFNRLSRLEFQQVIRFYRKRFGDLLKKRNLLR